MTDLKHLEGVTRALLATYEITAPPIPIEVILQSPHDDMWEELDITQISGSFFQVGVNYSPRMAMARVLVRHIVESRWGNKNGVNNLLNESDQQAFARMLIMPAQFILELDENSRTPKVMSEYFEVPLEDARLRMEDLSTYTP